MAEQFYIKTMTTVEDIENQNILNLTEEKEDIEPLEQIKPGEFFLSALQALIVNKRLPNGYKLEPEEIYLKGLDEESKKIEIVNKQNMVGKKRKGNVSFCL
jgi:hypothetical protein